MKPIMELLMTLSLVFVVAAILTACSSQPTTRNGRFQAVGVKTPTKSCIERGDCKVVNVADYWHMTNEEMQELAEHIVKTTPIPACEWNGNCPQHQGSFKALGGN